MTAKGVVAAEMVERYKHLAVSAAEWFAKKLPRNVSADELHAAALVGLWKAAETYEDGRQAFPVYARIRMRGEMLDWLRETDHASRRDRQSGAAAVLVPLPTDCFGRDELADPKACERDRQDRDDAAYHIERLMRHLAGAELTLVRMVLLGGVSQVEAAKRMGRCPSRVSQILSEAVQRMRRHRHASEWEKRS